MEPRQVVTEALFALVNGDLIGHLAYISDDVAYEINSSPTLKGKEIYQSILEGLGKTEVILEFKITSDTTGNEGQVIIQAIERRRLSLQQPDGQFTTLEESVPSSYSVKNNLIVQISQTILCGPNRIYRYP
jgi:hypothetical protein